MVTFHTLHKKIIYTTAKKKRPNQLGLFSWNLVITNCMQCFLYGPIGCN